MKPLPFALALLLALPLAGQLLAAQAATPEAEPVAALNAALIATMKAGSAHASFQARYDALDPVVKRALNLPVILQNSVGLLWSTVPPAQQQELSGLFEALTVASYVNGFGGYGGQQITVLPEEKPLGAKRIVETEIIQPGGAAPVRLDYVMSEGDAGWQVTDVLLNGTISRVAIQSSDFSALVNEGDASQLIAALKSKVAVLSGAGLKS
jgi:phospholipid transport system substrate-binding protein